MSNDAHDHVKVVIIGDSGVGKSNLLLKYADDKFSETYITTIGVDFRFRTISVDDKIVKLQIWDTAGQERFRTITSAYYRGADGILLVYDTTDASSYEHITVWLDEIFRFVSKESCMIMLVGNKVDAPGKVVPTEEVEKRAAESDLLFCETSAKTGENVEAAFDQLARRVIEKRKQRNEEKRKKDEQQYLLHQQNITLESANASRPVAGGCC